MNLSFSYFITKTSIFGSKMPDFMIKQWGGKTEKVGEVLLPYYSKNMLRSFFIELHSISNCSALLNLSTVFEQNFNILEN